MKKQLRAFLSGFVPVAVVALIVHLFGQSILTYVGLLLCVAPSDSGGGRVCVSIFEKG
jgi:hypothetical protein